jgi:hypothetical protein
MEETKEDWCTITALKILTMTDQIVMTRNGSEAEVGETMPNDIIICGVMERRMRYI